MIGKKKILIVSLVVVGLTASCFTLRTRGPRHDSKRAQPEGDKLKGTQLEIAALSDKVIAEEIKELESKMRKDDLINRLKEGRVTEDERKDANSVLLRLALLNVETSKRMRANTNN